MMNIFLCRTCTVNCVQPGSDTTEECETLLKKAVVRNPAMNFIISVTFFNIFW